MIEMNPDEAEAYIRANIKNASFQTEKGVQVIAYRVAGRTRFEARADLTMAGKPEPRYGIQIVVNGGPPVRVSNHVMDNKEASQSATDHEATPPPS